MNDIESAVRSCYSTWAQTYHADYYVSGYPPVHQTLVQKLLRESGAKTVLDAGCGPASMLRSFRGMGLDLSGFDLTPEMVIEARRVMGHSAYIWQGSVTDSAAFGGTLHDAAICIGVLPHVPQSQDQSVIENLRNAVRPGGLVIAEARNQFFALFSLNSYSHEFFMSELIGKVPERVKGKLAAHFNMDQPFLRDYDQVLSRTHNPLKLKAQFEEAGFKDVKTLFYHFHCLPPMFEAELPDFRERSLEMEDPEDWRGYFMASAFMIAGRRA